MQVKLREKDYVIDAVADYLTGLKINPNYILIHKILKMDNVNNEREFTDRYASFPNFLKVYKSLSKSL